MLSNMREAHYFTVQRHTSEKLVLNLLWLWGVLQLIVGMYVCIYLSLALGVFLSKISGIEKSYIARPTCPSTSVPVSVETGRIAASYIRIWPCISGVMDWGPHIKPRTSGWKCWKCWWVTWRGSSLEWKKKKKKKKKLSSWHRFGSSILLLFFFFFCFFSFRSWIFWRLELYQVVPRQDGFEAIFWPSGKCPAPRCPVLGRVPNLYLLWVQHGSDWWSLNARCIQFTISPNGHNSYSRSSKQRELTNAGLVAIRQIVTT